MAAITDRVDSSGRASALAVRIIRALVALGAAAAAKAAGERVVVINSVAQTEEQVRLIERLNGVPVIPGRYWYDPLSGLWGPEGGPPVGQTVPGLDPGGPLRADASGGGTGVFTNGRELHPLEVLSLRLRFGVVYPGRYWLNSQGVGGPEGGPPTFYLPLQAGGAPGSGAEWGRTTNPGTPGQGTFVGGDGACTYAFDASTGTSFMTGAC